MFPGIVSKLSQAPTVVAAATLPEILGDIALVTGSTVIATIPAPHNGGFSGILFLVPAEAVLTTTTGNILAAVTLPADKVSVLVYVKSSGKWVPSISA